MKKLTLLLIILSQTLLYLNGSQNNNINHTSKKLLGSIMNYNCNKKYNHKDSEKFNFNQYIKLQKLERQQKEKK